MVRIYSRGGLHFTTETPRLHLASASVASVVHTMGLQSVRVQTERVWVVCWLQTPSHYYEHMETGRCFPTAFDLGQMVDGCDSYEPGRVFRSLVPGHVRLVLNAIQLHRRRWRVPCCTAGRNAGVA